MIHELGILGTAGYCRKSCPCLPVNSILVFGTGTERNMKVGGRKDEEQFVLHLSDAEIALRKQWLEFTDEDEIIIRDENRSNCKQECR